MDDLNIVLKEERVRPIVKDQFLRDYLLGIGDTGEIFNIYCKTFNVPPYMPVRLVEISSYGRVLGEDWFFLKRLAENCFEEGSVILSCIVNGSVLLVVKDMEERPLISTFDKIHKLSRKCYSYHMNTMYSAGVRLDALADEYKRMKKCAEYRFYTNNAHLLATSDIKFDKQAVIEQDYAAVEHAAKNGDWESAREMISEFFDEMIEKTPAPAVAKTYCLELYVCLMRCCGVESMERYMKGVVEVQNFETLEGIRDYIMDTAKEITDANAPESPKVYSNLIQSTIDVVEKNLSNEHLSLRWLAGTILYTNVDYLGKLFKKETGKNFSHYVMSKRMEMAKSLIVEGKKDRIYEVAEKVGYGSNPQYFSQVFKKYTGISPLEYKEYARLSYRKKKTV